VAFQLGHQRIGSREAVPSPYFLAVLADSLNALAVGAPLVPGFLIFSPEPALIRALFFWILAYKPGLVAI